MSLSPIPSNSEATTFPAVTIPDVLILPSVPIPPETPVKLEPSQ